MNILCKLGIHDWSTTGGSNIDGKITAYKECDRCKKQVKIEPTQELIKELE